MKKVDVLIKGNLFCHSAEGGGIIASRQLPDNYDTGDAVIIEGDVRLSRIDVRNKTVLVLGHVTATGKGGDHGTL